MIAETKTCLCCSRNIKGRSDKKFCNDYCRNTHHNNLVGEDTNYIRNVNQVLRRNRRILKNLLPHNKQTIKTSRNTLQDKGFSFYYLTHSRKNKRGNIYQYCYEFGYRVLEDSMVIITRQGHEFG